MSQSTNDSYPTAIKVALILRNDKLVAELQQLVASFRAKGNQFIEIVKMGRTELQDAVPMTVGQEFHAFAASLEGEIAAPAGRREVPLRRQHGRDRDRHRHQRAQGLRGEVRRPAGEAHRQADRAGHGHARRDLGPAGLRRLLVGAQERRDQALEDLERPDPAHLRARAPASPRSTCRRCSRARRSCRARSIRSSPRWSTSSPSA